MDINKIFGAFDSSSRDDNTGKISSLYIKSPLDENHPRYFIKMFVKLVREYTNYGQQILNLLSKSEPSLNMNEVRQAGDIMLYSRAYEHLTNIDIHDEYHIKILFQEISPELEKALWDTLKHFEDEEEYEKCAVVKKYLDFLNLSS